MQEMTGRDIAVNLARQLAEDPAFQAALGDLIAFPTDASDPEAPLTAYLEHVAEGFAAMGFTTEHLEEDGHPFLLCSLVDHPDRPTVLSYAHGDTVPGMAGDWRDGRDPWTLTEAADEGRWYGRGIADNKGQMLVNMMGLQAVLAARGGLGFNLHYLIEMGEEIGSPGLRPLLQRLKPRLKADLLVASDGPRLSAEEPTLFLGARGGVTVKLHLKRRDGGRHSGNFGGILPNPALEMAHALATISGKTGALAVPGWQAPPVSGAARIALQDVEPADGLYSAGWGIEGLTPAERVFAANSAEVLAFTAGNPDAPVNAIPPEATAYVQLRFVPGIAPEDVAPALRQHLDAHGFQDITVEAMGPSFAASATPINHPAVQLAAASLARSRGQEPVVLPSLGGSLPNDMFTEDLGLPTIWVPHSYPGCSQHAPNEHLPKALFPEATALMAGLFWDLGKASRDELGLR